MSAFIQQARRGLPPRLPLSQLIASASEQIKRDMAEQRKEREKQAIDARLPSSADLNVTQRTGEGLLFSGNPHEAVPRRLLLDNRLSPLERNAWQVFRMLIRDDGLTAFPSYDQLQEFLSAQPFKRASRESVAKCLTVLRLTRWLSLCSRLRDDATGQNQGNVYMLHDDPITCAEAVEMDPGYLELIGNSLTHANKTVQVLAQHELDAVLSDQFIDRAALPSRLHIVIDRLSRQDWAGSQPEFGIRTGPNSDNQRVSSDTESGRTQLGSDTGKSLEAPEINRVRNPNSYSTVHTNSSVSKKPVLREASVASHPALVQLPAEQRSKAEAALAALDPVSQQTVLDEWAARCSQDSIRKPLGYLLRLVQKAIQGEFVVWAAQSSKPSRSPFPVRSGTAPAPVPTNTAHPVANVTGRGSAELGRSGIDQIRSMIKPWLNETNNKLIDE